jgi:hypothetical protein
VREEENFLVPRDHKYCRAYAPFPSQTYKDALPPRTIHLVYSIETLWLDAYVPPPPTSIVGGAEVEEMIRRNVKKDAANNLRVASRNN